MLVEIFFQWCGQITETISTPDAIKLWKSRFSFKQTGKSQNEQIKVFILNKTEHRVQTSNTLHFKIWNIRSRTWRLGDHLRTPGGKRLYRVGGVAALLGVADSNTIKRGYVYARVSSIKQRPDLDRQITDLQQAYPQHVLVKDIASGVNFKRQGLRTLLERALAGMVSEVVVMHRDRLARLGYDLLEFIFSKVGVRLVVHSRDEGVEEERDLADDLLAVASHNGRRAAANRKRRRAETDGNRTTCRGKTCQASED